MYQVKEVKDFTEWDHHLRDCNQINILQSWQYGKAKEDVENWCAKRFMVIKNSEKPVALAQFLVKSFPLVGGIARMNRGPLIKKEIEEKKREKVTSEVIAALLKEARLRRWWMVQMAPELTNALSAEESLRLLGLRKLAVDPWASGLLSLELSEEQIMMQFSGKWRNCLRKGLRVELNVSESNKNMHDLNELLNRYKNLREDKGFMGISDALILSLANQTTKGYEFNLFFANEAGSIGIQNAIGLLVCVCYGDTAIYFMGLTNELGRKLQANYVLLWHAILHAKRSGCSWFDIGGLNKTTPQGIVHFKQGLNAIPYQLIGEWRKFTFFSK